MHAYTTNNEAIDILWRSMPRSEWDMETPVMPLGSSMVLMTPDDVAAYAHETETCMATLRLVLCEPVIAPPLDMAVVLRHHFAPGQPIPQLVTQAFEALNATLASVPVIAWRATAHAVTIPETMLFSPIGNQVSTPLYSI